MSSREERDAAEPPAPPMSPELAASPEPRPARAGAGGTDFRARARQAKLRIALSTLKSGKVNTAASLLFDLYREHAGTPESQEAGAALSALADEHEAAGRHRMASEIYDKLTED